jgi:hypothetical protein
LIFGQNPFILEVELSVKNETQQETQQSDLKNNVVAVAKVGGCMASIAALAFVFFVIVLMLWMANP